MSTFDSRKKGFETKMVMDAEQEFRVQARRNKLLGLWVADLLGKNAEDAQKYAMSVVKADMEEAGDEDVFRKVKQDLIAAGNDMSDTDLRQRMSVLLTEAQAQILGDD